MKNCGKWHRQIFMILGLIICLLPAAAQNERYRPEQFERKERDAYQKPEEVIAAIGLQAGQSIADIGGGSGYFTRRFAKVVGPNGVAYCCDLATNLLVYLQERAKEEHLSNLVTVYAAPDRPMLPPGSVDHIFFCDTSHHLKDRVEYYRNLKPILREGGQLVVIDWHKREQEVGPPPGHNVARETVIAELKEAGWKLVREEDFLKYQYFLIFKPVDRTE
jgi:arsenite methyltransferase